MKQLSKIDKDVQDFLDTIAVKYSAAYVGQTAWHNTTADKFTVSFTRNNTVSTFDFYQGIGHREKRKDKAGLLEYAAAFRRLIDQQVSYPIIDDSLFTSGDSVFVFVPTTASVLYSLLLDAEIGQYTFPELCQDLGYDEDSRKALDTYLACQTVSKQLNSIFNCSEISHLQTLLEDY